MANRKPLRFWRYEVDEVWDTDAVKVGDVLIDRWHSDRTWHLLNIDTVTDAGGWHCKLLGEAPPEVSEKIRARMWTTPSSASRKS